MLDAKTDEEERKLKKDIEDQLKIQWTHSDERRKWSRIEEQSQKIQEKKLQVSKF